MAKRAMMYCPRCRMVGLPQVELVTENPEQDVFRCPNSHAFTNYMELMKLNPDMIKLIAQEKPQAGDVKTEVWVDKQVLDRFNSLYPAKINATVNSILSLHLYGDPVIIDGIQAKKLHAMHVRNGAEVVAALEVARALEDQLATAQQQIALYQGMFASAGIMAPA
jgi:hypothetical protein